MKSFETWAHQNVPRKGAKATNSQTRGGVAPPGGEKHRSYASAGRPTPGEGRAAEKQQTWGGQESPGETRGASPFRYAGLADLDGLVVWLVRGWLLGAAGAAGNQIPGGVCSPGLAHCVGIGSKPNSPRVLYRPTTHPPPRRLPLVKDQQADLYCGVAKLLGAWPPRAGPASAFSESPKTIVQVPAAAACVKNTSLGMYMMLSADSCPSLL